MASGLSLSTGNFVRLQGSTLQKPYGDPPDDQVIFNRMDLMQEAALATLARRNLIRPDEWANAQVHASDVPLPTELQTRIDIRNAEESDLISFLVVLATEYKLLGPNGLKARSGLLEFRHDPL